LVVHGEQDQLIRPELGRQLFDAAFMPKAFVLVPSGSHHTTHLAQSPVHRQSQFNTVVFSSLRI
jgi:hypothetical protein